MAAGADDYEFGASPGVAPAGHTRLSSPSDGEMSVRGTSGAASNLEKVSQKNVANGYAGLGAGAKLADAQVAESNVTQHEAALSVAFSQISDAITAVAEGAVTAHEAALTVAVSQLSDPENLALTSDQVTGPTITAVAGTATFNASTVEQCLHVDDGTALAVTLPGPGESPPAANTWLYVLIRGTGDLTFVAGSGATIDFDDVTYAAGPTRTGKGLTAVFHVGSGVYWITGDLDLA